MQELFNMNYCQIMMLISSTSILTTVRVLVIIGFNGTMANSR